MENARKCCSSVNLLTHKCSISDEHSSVSNPCIDINRCICLTHYAYAANHYPNCLFSVSVKCKLKMADDNEKKE